MIPLAHRGRGRIGGLAVALLAAIAGLVPGGPARGEQEQSVTLFFNERPPYKLRLPDGTIGGIALTPAIKAFAKAGIPVVWEELPTARQLRDVREGTRRACAVGFYLTPERAAFSKVSEPVSRDGRMVVLAGISFPAAENVTIADLLGDPHDTLLLKNENSYGALLDEAIAKAKVKIEWTSMNYNGITRMVVSRESYFTFATPEDIAYQSEQQHWLPGTYRMLSVQGLPDGEARYILCNKAVDDDTIRRLNAFLMN